MTKKKIKKKQALVHTSCYYTQVITHKFLKRIHVLLKGTYLKRTPENTCHTLSNEEEEREKGDKTLQYGSISHYTRIYVHFHI